MILINSFESVTAQIVSYKNRQRSNYKVIWEDYLSACHKSLDWSGRKDTHYSHQQTQQALTYT
jgi:hypothetical protein